VQSTKHKTTAEKQGFRNVWRYPDRIGVKVKGADWQHPLGTDSGIDGMGNYPVTHVSWADVNVYYLFREKRLATEAEWKKVARGQNGLRYPWGNDLDVSQYNHYQSDLSQIASVGSYSKGVSVYGVQDLIGNVSEWVVDYYRRDYYKDAIPNSPQWPLSGPDRSVRGGSFGSKLGFHTLPGDQTCRQRKLETC
jgi:sulfatase modifying factor 1